jgi:hypothetical protein
MVQMESDALNNLTIQFETLNTNNLSLIVSPIVGD